MDKIIIILLFPTLCIAGDFDLHDKQLFASVCLFQVIDGLTTMDVLKHDGNYMDSKWSWKYGTKYPSAAHVWGLKAVELVGAYYVGKALPSKWRKGFYLLIDATLIYCIQHNLNAGAGFSITF